MQTRKDHLKTTAKILVGALLVAYVVKSGMIDFGALRTLLFNPRNFAIGIFFLLVSMLCCSLRWYILMRAQGLKMTYRSVVSLTMIGNFFNTFMPGSVGGDLIKAWYVAGREPQQKTRAILTVLLDRIIGLAVIIFYAATAMLFYLHWLEAHAELQMVAYSIWLFTAASALFSALFFIPWFQKVRAFTGTVKWLRRFPVGAKMLDTILLYRSKGGVILASMLLSAASILGINILYYLQGTALGIPMTMSQYFFVAPIALVVSAVPLLPGGIGTGQVAFYTLFKWVGMPDPDMGGTLCTLVQIYTVLFNCTGAIFYLKFKRRPKDVTSAQSISLAQGQSGILS